jgi:hypothetical protein
LNSGQGIAGEIGPGPFGYTAVGEQVGMAQRMESVALPGGVMLSASTARLVEGTAALGDREFVHIKGAAEPSKQTSYESLETSSEWHGDMTDIVDHGTIPMWTPRGWWTDRAGAGLWFLWCAVRPDRQVL